MSVVPLTIHPTLEWRGITVELGLFAVRDVSVAVAAGSWTCIVGPSGAGKTLLLEIAAGFLAPSYGKVLRAGSDVTGSPPEIRRIAYAPQDGLLFPHLNVRKNLAFGAGRLGTTGCSMESVAEELGIAHLLGRRVTTLSGGEAQRVALGRVLLSGSDVLLLDECTSALDEDTRTVIGDVLIRHRRRRRGLAVVQVTHDRAEAGRLADVVVSMDAGRIVDLPGAGSMSRPDPADTRKESRT